MGVPKISVGFRYLTGIRRPLFENVRLVGNWDEDGHPTKNWREYPMAATRSRDGCPAFAATLGFDPGMVGNQFSWGVRADGPTGTDLWVIPTEVGEDHGHDRQRSFILRLGDPKGMQLESYALNPGRSLGAHKDFRIAGQAPGAFFAVWAPHAWKVEVVFANPKHGYIADDGAGQDRSLGPFELAKDEGGVWSAGAETHRDLGDFARLEGRPYYYRVTLASGKVVYRTDLYSRMQAGRGATDPGGRPWSGSPIDLDGTVSGSLVVDLDVVEGFSEGRCSPEYGRFPVRDFWKDELQGSRPKATSVADLVTYELHVGALGSGECPGTLRDALEFLDYLEDLGVNAIELMPLAEFNGWASWGYGPSHLLAPEASAGGRPMLQHFVREAHRRGMLVLADVVYNHFAPQARRAMWQYDSLAPEENTYYWYEGRAADYDTPAGGYLENGSSGYAPRYSEERVRQMFLAAAVELVEDFQIDGFRVDLSGAITQGNRLHQDGSRCPAADQAGERMLREWSRTLRMIKPDILLIAEDHTDEDRTLVPVEEGGLGFDARWRASFYHHLVGDSQPGESWARLLEHLAREDSGPAPWAAFAQEFAAAGPRDVVYHESHDQAGNSSYLDDGVRRFSRRTMSVASGGRPAEGAHRLRAFALARMTAALAMLGRGSPLFLMGEEVGAEEAYHYDDFLWHRVDLAARRADDGRFLFAFYRDLIALRRRSTALRKGELRILRAAEAERMLVFERRFQGEHLVVLVNGQPHGFPRGYRLYGLELEDGNFHEVLNSDAASYAGDGLGNARRDVPCRAGMIEPVLGRFGVVVLRRG